MALSDDNTPLVIIRFDTPNGGRKIPFSRAISGDEATGGAQQISVLDELFDACAVEDERTEMMEEGPEDNFGRLSSKRFLTSFCPCETHLIPIISCNLYPSFSRKSGKCGNVVVERGDLVVS